MDKRSPFAEHELINQIFTHHCSVLTFVTAAESHDSSSLQAEVRQLRAMMQEQHRLIKDLQQKINKNENIQNIFDCYRTRDWKTIGTITFNGCSVDTTTIKPWRGNFSIQDFGVYRFTFEGLVGVPDQT